MTTIPEEELNLVGAARRANITASAIRYWILTGKLPAKKVNGRWVIKTADVDRVNKETLSNANHSKRGPRGRYVRNEALDADGHRA